LSGVGCVCGRINRCKSGPVPIGRVLRLSDPRAAQAVAGRHPRYDSVFGLVVALLLIAALLAWGEAKGDE
jgi:hypothetical protein